MPEKYPECEKMLAARDKSQAIGEFLEWLQSGEADTIGQRPVLLALYDVDQLISFSSSVEQLLARFFEIDLNKVEEERLAMLEEMQKEATKK